MHAFFSLVPSLILALLATSNAAHAAPVQSNREEARQMFAEAIAYRTARGHGQVPAFASSLAERLKEAGFTDDDIELIPIDADGEATVAMVVRYRGDGSSGEKALGLLAHMDVVEALPSDWERPPFELIEEDGFFFGRGTIDNKHGVVLLTHAFMRLKREGFVPSRDLVLLFTGDEETGMVTTRHLAKHTPEQYNLGFIINSDAGGGSLDDDGNAVMYNLQAAEKTYVTFDVTVKNPGGHSSRPRKDNAIYELSEALVNLRAYSFPVQYNDLTLSFFAAMGEVLGDEAGAVMKRFVENPMDEQAVSALRANPLFVGTTGTTCVATMLSAGHAENALPQTASATVNCRVFPGMSIAEVVDHLKGAFQNDTIDIAQRAEAVVSPVSEVPEDIEAAIATEIHKRYPGVRLVPYLESGGTDGMHFRLAGVPTVASSGIFMNQKNMFAHGLNERVRVDQFYAAQEYWYQLLKNLGS